MTRVQHLRPLRLTPSTRSMLEQDVEKIGHEVAQIRLTLSGVATKRDLEGLKSHIDSRSQEIRGHIDVRHREVLEAIKCSKKNLESV